MKSRNTPYMLYIIDKRPQLKSQNPSMSGNDIMKLLGSTWKDLPEKEKEVSKLYFYL